MVAYMDHKDLANETIDDARRQEIVDGVHRVLDGIAAAESDAGRAAGSVRLLAATKTRDVGEIMAAIDAGVRMIGENRPQEIEVKASGLVRQCAGRGFALGEAANDGTDDAHAAAAAVANAGAADAASGSTASVPAALAPLPFHLIGQLQSNKINKVLPHVTTIESVDNFALAQKIAKRAEARGLTVGVLLEVNESGEESKSGCEPAEAADLAAQIAELKGLHLEGLMTIGAHVPDEAVIRRGFAHLRETRDALLASGVPVLADCRELSMGMTHDMAIAISEGSTIVRVGTAIFGERAFI
ncbi:YggS family pyridoxal phosphate-dependent enzyme [Bifidobacterium tissieri]|uniref:Pyridoxal phosphate homeostasis protein n=1 Tax=Bifidobacterium tissieri TaxID=1630162 RepID=A0A5M9ZKY4_9BIFI|nr:YggS family pyridoxal phosphate-dependent enzyme [Bifidobacterium tissieri]KAA8827552.1 YggS family pyridoxal phosphate-dependent enzyme [Bifidobacterium tissieri]KAA8831007.1 YggS family pyridoxal phosphate-dependent enzyme [Bifidobacterium tissieri]